MGTHRDPWADGSGAEADAAFYREHGYWPVPRLVQWLVTAACSLGCPHCSSATGRRGEELDLTESAELLDQVAALGVPELLLTGGEPVERPDLPAIIELLAARGLRWSLNTAVMPNEACQAALRRWPPSFVAVSVDGPESLHDAFRGRAGALAASLQAIELYAELTDGHVAAGTTVTAHNVAHLDATFREVVRSGASSWGLHLLVPEGRAERRPELQISQAEARELLDFVAARRPYFPVTMADEIGYCGELEPLVRDTPFYCGAGRAQCVVLSDGHLVPCTTVDRSAAVGSIRERPLAELWHQGFAELRHTSLEPRCARCEYLSACGGGCWLQRRHGTQCFLPAWHRPGALAGAAGVAVCLGLAACGGAPASPAAAVPSAAAESSSATARPATPVPTVTATSTESGLPLELPLARCAIASLAQDRADRRHRDRLVRRLQGDPALPLILDLLDDQRSPVLAERAVRIRAALGTKEPSLYLASLLWRDLGEWCLDCTPPAERSAPERQLLRELLAELHATVDAWRLAIAQRGLDPYLTRDDAAKPRFMLTKALTERATIGVHSELAFKHWGTLPNPAMRAQITRAFLARHPFALGLRLTVEAGAEAGLQRLSGQQISAIAGSASIDVFDLLVVPPGDVPVPVTIRYGAHHFRVTGKGKQAKVTVAQAAGNSLVLALPAGTDLTHADLTRLAYEQHRDRLGDARRTPFELAALREQLATELSTTPRDRDLIDRTRWRLLLAWLF